MRRTILAVPIGISVLASCSTAPPAPAVPGYVDTAEVLQAEPLYQLAQVARPVNECWTETVVQNSPRRGVYAGPLAGGIIGGVLGNRLASGRGSTSMTVGGTLLGAAIGHTLSAASQRPPTTANVRRCRTVNRLEPRQQLVGYRVHYRYEGQTFTTRTRGYPGKYIRVRVDVDPVDGT
ncbi:MAG: hypothetical protein LJE58_09435 [Thiogranum sp.]|jgi:uncharacterized protein YcfJ|nr:hypothetical protein [Thiogranum sp.]